MSIELANKLKARAGNTTYLSEAQKLSRDNAFTPKNYTVSDFEEDASVQVAFDKVTDYLSDHRGVGSALLDQATMGEQTDVVEFLRDDVARLGAPLSKANILKDAPEDVKAAYRLMQDRFNASSLTGAKEHFGAIVDYGADLLFNPETAGMVASLFAAPVTGGLSAATGVAVRKTGQVAAKGALTNALKATAATKTKDPLKAAAAIGSIYGGAGMHVAQELDLAIDQKDEYSIGQTAMGVGIGALAGAGLYKAGSAISNRYFREGTNPKKPRTPEEDSKLYEEAIEGEFIPASGGSLVDEALRLVGPEGSTRSTKTVDGADDALDAAASKFADDLGGGEKTRDEILAAIRAASDSEDTVEGVRNRVQQSLYTIASDLSGNFYGKAAGVLSPFTKLSGTAAQLQKKLSHEFGIKFKVQDEVVPKDLSEVQRMVTGKFNDRFRAIVEDISIHAAKGTLAEDMNKALMLSVRSAKNIVHDQFDPATNKAIRLAAKGVKDLYADMGVDLKKIGVIDDLVDNYIPRMWNRSAIEKNQKGLIELLQSKGGMTKGDAQRTVDSMLDIKNHVDEGSSGGYFFSSKRKLNDIGNDADFQEFLNDDVLGSLYAYTFQAGKSIAKHRVLGVKNFDEFKGFYINRIRKEVEAKGETFSSKQAKQLEMLYRTATGEGLERYGKTGQDIVDVYGFTNRIAMLGLVTVSSLTEVFLNVAKAGVRNSVKGLGEAMEFSFKNVTKDLESKLVTNNKLTVKEAMSEMRQFSIHVDQAMAQLGDRLSGDALVNERLQNASNKFFRLNMLDQWTKFVQATSFSAGKHLINENIEALAKNGNRELTGRMQSRAGELAELGIDYKKAVDWHNAGGKMDDAFYKDDVLGGVARYTNSVILQPSAMSGLKPLLHSNPKTAILFQLLGYPAAFTNTVLKGAAKSLSKDPIRNAGKIVPAALIMTGMARWTNYLRTNGESEKNKDLDEVLYNSVARWGGNGILLDTFKRAQTSAKYTQSSLSYAAMPFGPVASDAINLIQQGIVPVVGNKVPLLSGTYFGKQILGDEEVTHYRRGLRNAQEEVFGGLIPKFDKEVMPPGYAMGGIVKVGVKAITNVVSDIAGNKLSTLPAKIYDKKSPEMADEIAENLNKATDNYFNEDMLSTTSTKIANGLDELEMQGTIDSFDFEHLEFVDASIFNEIRRDIKSIEDLEKVPSWKKAIESADEAEAVKNWAQAQKDLGFSKEHRKALNIIQTGKNEIDPEGEVEYLVPDLVRSLRQAFAEVNIVVTPEEIAKAQSQKFDDETFDFMHDFISSSARMRMESLSEIGGDKVAENVLIKLAAEGEIDFPKIKAPKLQDTADDVYPEPLTGNQRLAAAEKYREKSAEKAMMFRAETSFQRAQSFLAFAFAREVGVHVGSEGAATTIAIRGLPNTKAKQDFKLEADAQSLTRERSSNYFGNRDLLKEEEGVLSSTTKVEDDMPIDEYGYFGSDAMESEELLKIKPITMNAGYVDIRNPLNIDSDLPGWEAERILTPGGGFDEYFMPEIQRRGVKITKKQEKKLEDLTKRSEEFEGLFLDPPVGEPTDLVSFYRQELKRTSLNREFREVLQDMGFDSIQYRNEVEIGFEGESAFSYILFNPEQFKSVTARAFDPTDSRHGAAEGGYIVKGGDTLSNIARTQGVPIEEIARINGIKDINKIFQGQKLKFSEVADEVIVAQAKAVKAAEPVAEIEKTKPQEEQATLTSSRKRTVRALRKNIENKSSSRTRRQVAEQRSGGLFNSQTFKNLASYINPFGKDKTEADYSPEVIAQLKIAAQNAVKSGRTNIDYGDYSKESNVVAQTGMPQQRTRDRLLTRAVKGELTPTEEAAFSVGGAQVEVEGDDVYVTDIYDFAKLKDEERTTENRDRYSYLRDFMSKIPGNEFRSKIKIGSKEELGL